MAQVSECTTQADAARRLGVSRHRINNLIQMGRLQVEHLADGTPVVLLSAIEDYARQRADREARRTEARGVQSGAGKGRA
jgi:predicted DNA-binding protein (UPF0251 family)